MKKRIRIAGSLAAVVCFTIAPGVATAQPGQEPRPAPASTATYERLTARQWALIAKDPDAHAGEHYVVFGVVTQSDAATGPDMLLAHVDGVRHSDAYAYPTNTLVAGDESDFAKIVEDDMFTAQVEVTGSLTYDTQVGGSTTAPLLHADTIKVLVPAP
ncbi:hypothetical protein [Streptomyces sp. cg35]|uniref:hypothetical protein n=1 Tax=Streptomyces sp. cg35 TaxID=3421650 RepID=UPI003D17C9BE